MIITAAMAVLELNGELTETDAHRRALAEGLEDTDERPRLILEGEPIGRTDGRMAVIRLIAPGVELTVSAWDLETAIRGILHPRGGGDWSR